MNNIDAHAHILPKADHGSNSVEMSLAHMHLARKADISTIFATPHYYPHKHDIESFLLRCDIAQSKLDKANNTGVKIENGAEILLCEGLANLDGLEELTMANSKVLLTEMPDPPWTHRIIDSLLKIRQIRGLTPLLAHVDRYPVQEIEGLFQLGFQGQINAQAVCSFVKRKQLYRWCDKGQIVALGSDIHTRRKKYKYYDRAMKILGDRGKIIQANMKEIFQLE